MKPIGPSHDADIAVVGAGPAGIRAALTADRLGLRVTLLDEAEAPGGQVYRAVPDALRPETGEGVGADLRAGDSLRARLAESSVDARLERLALNRWCCSPKRLPIGPWTEAAGPIE